MGGGVVRASSVPSAMASASVRLAAPATLTPGTSAASGALAFGSTRLRTPSQAVLVDPANPQRILLGTPGGVLVSGNGGLQWHQSEMRKDVHGLSQENGKFFAVTTERIVYGSNDGTNGWTALTP